MTAVGLIPHYRLDLIPNRYHVFHEYCFFLHDQITNLIKEYDMSGAVDLALSEYLDILDLENNEYKPAEIFKFLKENDEDGYKHYILSHVIMALSADMMNFIYESLICFEKRKFTVGFALMRKPLKENLFFLSYVLARPNEFLSKFEKDNYESLNDRNLGGNDRSVFFKQIFKEALEHVLIDEWFDEDLIWDILYGKKINGGLEVLFQKSMHLITNQGDLLKTSDYDLNNIFDDPTDDYYYDRIYRTFPYIILYALNIMTECFQRITPMIEKKYQYQILSMAIVYESIMLKNKKNHMLRITKSFLEDILVCISCASKIKIHKRDVPRLFMAEEIECRGCGAMNVAPVSWLFSKVDISLKKLSHET